MALRSATVYCWSASRSPAIPARTLTGSTAGVTAVRVLTVTYADREDVEEEEDDDDDDDDDDNDDDDDVDDDDDDGASSDISSS